MRFSAIRAVFPPTLHLLHTCWKKCESNVTTPMTATFLRVLCRFPKENKLLGVVVQFHFEICSCNWREFKTPQRKNFHIFRTLLRLQETLACWAVIEGAAPAPLVAARSQLLGQLYPGQIALEQMRSRTNGSKFQTRLLNPYKNRRPRLSHSWIRFWLRLIKLVTLCLLFY